MAKPFASFTRTARPTERPFHSRRIRMSNFKFEVDADGIALITWDMPGKSMNVIDVSVMEELEGIVEKVSADAAIKGAVVTSGKDTFGGGADLTMLEKQRDDYETTFRQKGEEAAVGKVFQRSRPPALVFCQH